MYLGFRTIGLLVLEDMVFVVDAFGGSSSLESEIVPRSTGFWRLGGTLGLGGISSSLSDISMTSGSVLRRDAAAGRDLDVDESKAGYHQERKQ